MKNADFREIETVKALLLKGANDFTLCDVKFEKLPSMARVKINASTICGSDVKLIKGEMEDIKLPIVPGHEWSGKVEEVPEEYKHLIGKNVVTDILENCGSCLFCKTQTPNLCNNLEEPGFTRSGSFSEQIYVRPENLRILPDSISPIEGCLLEPLSVALYALKRVPITEEDKVLIVGGGAIGLLLAQVIKLKNPKHITLLDHHANRLSMARFLGVDEVINPHQTMIIDFYRKYPELRPSVAFEVTGSCEGLNWCIESADKKGRIGIIGFSGSQSSTIFTSSIMTKLLEIRGILSPTTTIDEAISLVESKKVNLSPLLTHEVPLDHFHKAYHLASSRKHETLRVAVIP